MYKPFGHTGFSELPWTKAKSYLWNGKRLKYFDEFILRLCFSLKDMVTFLGFPPNDVFVFFRMRQPLSRNTDTNWPGPRHNQTCCPPPSIPQNCWRVPHLTFFCSTFPLPLVLHNVWNWFHDITLLFTLQQKNPTFFKGQNYTFFWPISTS